MRKPFFSLVVALLFFSLSPQGVMAANTTVGVSPQSGSFDKPFTVNLVIDGHGDKFNAAEATVKVSPSIKIKDLTLGDCNFSSYPNDSKPFFLRRYPVFSFD